MSQLGRTNLNRVYDALVAELKAIAEREGPEAIAAVPYFEITVDHESAQQVMRVQIEIHKTCVYQFRLAVSSIYEAMSDGELENRVSAVMRNNLSILGQLHYVRLHKLFPHAIRDVQVEYDATQDLKVVKVLFKNGHIAEAPEHESKTDLFIARCSMLFDLPPL